MNGFFCKISQAFSSRKKSFARSSRIYNNVALYVRRLVYSANVASKSTTMIECNVNEITVKKRTCAVGHKGGKRVKSVAYNLAEEVGNVGRYVPVSLGGNIIIFRHDSGTNITQLSTSLTRELRRRKIAMSLTEWPTVTWKTAEGSRETKMKLWLMREVSIVGLLEDVHTAPCDMLVLQNPYIGDDEAFLGLSTLVQLRLLTDHHAGALMGHGGLRIKMWASKNLALKVLAHARSAAEVVGTTATTNTDAPAAATAGTDAPAAATADTNAPAAATADTEAK